MNTLINLLVSGGGAPPRLKSFAVGSQQLSTKIGPRLLPVEPEDIGDGGEQLQQFTAP
jgi:hypothetical protein